MHATEVASTPHRTLHISGQVGANARGEWGSDAQVQCEYAFENIKAVLRDADMGFQDLIKVRRLVASLAALVGGIG